MARSSRRGKRVDNATLASALALAALHGDKSASEKFGVSSRTLQRAREAIRDGKAPELARVVAEQKAHTVTVCRDLLRETFEKSLRRLQDVLPDAEPREVIGAVKIVGELVVARDALNGEQPGADSESSEAEEAAGAASEASSPPPLH